MTEQKYDMRFRTKINNSFITSNNWGSSRGLTDFINILMEKIDDPDLFIIIEKRDK